MVLAGYYLVAARSELTAFFQATVVGRVVAGAGLIIIVALWDYWPAVIFGLVDIAAALWTRAVLADEQSERQATPAGPSDPVWRDNWAPAHDATRSRSRDGLPAAPGRGR